MTVKDQEKRRDLLIGRETRLLGELPLQRIQFAISYTESLKDDDFFTQEKKRKQQSKIDALPVMTPTKEGLKAIAEAREDEKKGRLTKAVNPSNKKALAIDIGGHSGKHSVYKSS